MLLDSNVTPIVESTPQKDLMAIKEEIDASITSSGLLAKHNANIARLASSFGISLGAKEETKVEQLLKHEDPIFDES